MKTINDGSITLGIDSNGMIASLKKEEGYDFVAKPGLWRIIYQREHEQEIELLASDLPCMELTVEGRKAVIVHESELVKVKIEAALDANNISFDAEVTCNDDILIREFQFPYFNLGQLPEFSLIRSSRGGAFFKNIQKSFSQYHSDYIAQDNKAIVMNELYPGQASTNCFCIFKPGCGLYFGSHDKTFQTTMHHLRYNDEGIYASIVKYPFLKKSESVRYEGFTLAWFNGDWHEAAKIYRDWANSWFCPPTPPEWIRNFNGWQRLIMRHQYGQTFFKYTDLPKMLKDGLQAGIDSLLLFGWWTDGMDAGYPDYKADVSQGGFEALKAGIDVVHERGGKVLLYFNGQLIDHDTEFYKKIGKKIAVRMERGDEHTETYNFSGEGTSLREFGNRVFSTACFSCREWIDVLKKNIDKAIALGVDCAFFDQFGLKLWPCFDGSHDHPVPDMQGFDRKAKVVEELYAYVKSKASGIALGTEIVSDRLASHVDFFHTVNSGYGPLVIWRGGGESFLEWFRFIFPEIIISDRDIRDDKSDYKRRVNNAIQMGLKTDVEIYRCRATIAAAPKYAEYLKQANELREKIKDFIFKGHFLDDTPIKMSNSEIRAKAYKSDSKLLVITTHRHEKTLSGSLEVSGYTLENYIGLGEFTVDAGDGLKISLAANSIAAMVFNRL